MRKYSPSAGLPVLGGPLLRVTAPRRRYVAVSIVAITLLAQLSSVQALVINTTSDAKVYMGQDTEVIPGGFNYQYLGTADLFGCQNVSRPWYQDEVYCAAHIPTGDAWTRIRLRSDDIQVNDDPFARAGVGFRYTLVTACRDQTIQNVQVNSTYYRSKSLQVTQADVEIWGDAFYGRGTPAIPEVANTTHVLLDTTTSTPNAPTPVTKSLTSSPIQPPSGVNTTYTALVYVKLHAEQLGTTDTVSAAANSTLKSMTFDFTDNTAPTVNHTIETPAGSPGAVTTSGVTWYRSNFTLALNTDDRESCPKHAFTRIVPGDYEPLNITWGKDTVRRTFTEDAAYPLEYFAQNYQLKNSASVPLSLGIDRVPPAITMTPNYGPDGDNGWYRTRPTITVSATDATSGFHGGQYTVGGGSWVNWPSSPFAYAPADGNITLTTKAWDRASNTAWLNNSFAVDATPPSPVATCKPGEYASAECSANWYNRTLNITMSCGEPHSPCVDLAYSLNGQAYTNYSTNLIVFDEGTHTLSLRAQNVAGLVGYKNYTLKIDKTPPIQASVREIHNATLIRVNGTWNWSATDDRSGIKEFAKWFRNGAGTHSNSTSTARQETITSVDGENCLKVAGRDNAGNLGPYSDQACVWVDDTPPTVQINKTQPGKVYVRGEPLPLVTLPGQPSVVVGDVTFQTWARDISTTWASGLVLHRTLIDNQAWTPVGQTSDACELNNQTCSQTYSRNFWLGSNPATAVAFKEFKLVSRDRALNYQNATQKFDHVMMVAVPAVPAPTSFPAISLHWVPYDGADAFSGWEIHRSLAEDFVPTAATKIADVSGPSTDTYQDASLGLQSGVTYHYRVVAVTSGTNPLDLAASASNSYPAVYRSSTPDGNAQVSYRAPEFQDAI